MDEVAKEELNTIYLNLNLGRQYYDWEIIDRAIQRLAELNMSLKD